MTEARPENEFPTVRDFRDRLSELVERGLGDLPAQILVVPDSTLQAIARASAPEGYDPTQKPALMIDLDGVDGRMAVGLISVDHMQSRATQ